MNEKANIVFIKSDSYNWLYAFPFFYNTSAKCTVFLSVSLRAKNCGHSCITRS